MKTAGVLGGLFLIGLILLVAGIEGRFGALLAIVFNPQMLVVTNNSPANHSRREEARMATDADIQAIRAFVSGGGKLTVDKEGNVVAPIADPAASEATPAAATETDAAPASPKRAARRSAKAAKSAKSAIEPMQQPGNDEEARNVDVRAPKAATSGANNLFGRVVDWLANLPTPGGNLALLLILVFFAWAIIPVNHGATRLQLIWLVLIGKADLMNQPDTSQGSSNGGKWWQPYLDPSADSSSSSSSASSGGGPGAFAALPAPSAPLSHPSAVAWTADDLLVSPRGPSL